MTGLSLPASRSPLRAVMPETGTAVLREGAIARPIHRVTLLELGDISPGRLDGTGGVHATNADLGLAQAKAHDAHQIG
jgi:hypothetical protein